MTLQLHDYEQGSDEWFAARCGLLTASEMKHIITEKTLKIANNDKTRAHVYELAAQRITRYTEPHYFGDEMLRGVEDEVKAKILYGEKYAPVTEIGFVTNSKWGFTLGCSPDGFVGDDGLVECKSRRQKFQIETIANDEVPSEYMLQIQTLLLVTERKWCDFVSYCGGMPMYVKRVVPDTEMQSAIIEAAHAFHDKIDEVIEKYNATLNANKFPMTEREVYEEVVL